MEPALRVLVAIADDADVIVDDYKDVSVKVSVSKYALYSLISLT